MDFYLTAALEMFAVAFVLLLATVAYGITYARGAKHYCSRCDRYTALRIHRCASLKRDW